MEKQSNIREFTRNLTCYKKVYDKICIDCGRVEHCQKAESQIVALIPLKASHEKRLILETSYEKGYWQGRNDCIDEMKKNIDGVRG